MNVKTLCLAILSFGEATGYDIRKRAAEGPLSYFIESSFGSIYPALDRLWREGLIEKRREARPGRPSRKVYSLTEAGEKALVEALHQPLKPDVFKSEFLLVALLADYVEPKHMAQLAHAKSAELEQRLEQLRSALDACESEAMRWVLSYGIAVHEAAIRFMQVADRPGQ